MKDKQQELREWKLCTVCGLKKDRSNFVKDRKKPDGLYYSCRECKAKKAKAYYDKNRDKILADDVRYFQENKERLMRVRKEYHKEYYEKNKVLPV